jgi:ubiquinone/menaquinone biosynthesis C-methylase UbiE
MQSLDECVVQAMDGDQKALFSFLPYIVQDLWEFGTNADHVVELIAKHLPMQEFNLLDLGCGKGAVGIKAAKKFQCRVLGIDAVEAFIEEAKTKADHWGVTAFCNFSVGDIRKQLPVSETFEVIVLGAIGPVFGDYASSLQKLLPMLSCDGILIIDDAWINDASEFTHSTILKRSQILMQVENAGMKVLEVDQFEHPFVESLNNEIYDAVERRCLELAQKFPSKANLFYAYLDRQRSENDVLETKVEPFIIVLTRF